MEQSAVPFGFQVWVMRNVWEKENGEATDAVFVRRAYLDLAGRLPTAEEARAYARDDSPEKKRILTERLIASTDFADYWSMKFCDLLRVKSEFPVNLWPNAVYVYHRRIRAFVANGERWDDFAHALFSSRGSNFRVAEVNFFRATAVRTPEGMAAAAVRTFLDQTLEDLDAENRAFAIACFASVRFKGTREWKEEIVHVDPAAELKPDDFAKRLRRDWAAPCATAFTRLVRRHLLNDAQAGGGTPTTSLRDAVMETVLSSAYGAGPITGGFPLKRLDAEVLDDAIVTLTGTKHSYSSIAPEPFTFLPGDRRSVLIEDGSVSSAFLLLFGRPARDTGLFEERDNGITAKQRLYLNNSSALYGKLVKLAEEPAFKKLSPEKQVEDLYWRFYARAPEPEELAAAQAARAKMPPKTSWRFARDLAWCLVNSKEFLYRH